MSRSAHGQGTETGHSEQTATAASPRRIWQHPIAGPPDAGQVARFAGDLAHLGVSAGDRLCIAVSGGADSLALLLLAAAARPEGVIAATVDHGLRPEARAEAEHVSAICDAIGVVHACLTIRMAGGNALQQRARQQRYQALAQWAGGQAEAILTAHHMDDQAETLVARLMRGAGCGGLAGVRAINAGPVTISSVPTRIGPGPRVLRPLLGWRHAELAAIVAAAGLVPVDDPSNRDGRFDRTRIRAALAATPWLDPAPLARSAAALAECDEALTWMTHRLLRERARRSGDTWRLDPDGLPAELQRRLLLELLKTRHQLLTGFDMASWRAPRGRQIARIAADLAAGRRTTVAGLLCDPGPPWTFTPAPARRPVGPSRSRSG